MVNIGLITINACVPALNFAIPLHQYAFQQFLLKYGYNSTIIDYKRPETPFDFDYRHPADFYAAEIKKIKNISLSKQEGLLCQDLEEQLKKNKNLRDKYRAIYKERETRYDKFKKFITKYCIRTKKRYYTSLLDVSKFNFDCYICVTDIIWSKFKSHGHDRGFFLSSTCMENKWKISYAASKLIAENSDDKKKTTTWIQDMDFVSVREDYLQRYLIDHVRTDVAWVLDPVLLHKKDFYEPLLIRPKEEKYLLLYYVVVDDPPIINNALEFAKKHNLKIIELSNKYRQSKITKNQNDVNVIYRYDVGVEEWLGYIYYADYIFTNSFHGCCFSVLFEKTFFAERRNPDKVSALLHSVGLDNRIIDKQDVDTMPKTIDHWESVRDKLDKKRKESECFILNALTIAERNPHPIKDYSIAKKYQKFPLYYNTGYRTNEVDENILPQYKSTDGKFYVRVNTVEYIPKDGKIINNGLSCFHHNVFLHPEGKSFTGYRLRVVIDKHPENQFYLLDNGDYQSRISRKKKAGIVKVFQPGEHIPIILFHDIRSIVAEAIWK